MFCKGLSLTFLEAGETLAPYKASPGFIFSPANRDLRAMYAGIAFDENGNLIRNTPSLPAFRNELRDLEKRLVLRYLGKSRVGLSRNIACRFEVTVPHGISEKDIVEVRNWVNGKVSLPQNSRTILEREGPKRFRISIVGTGADDRCRWCRSFRTALTTRMNRLERDVLQDGFCYFES